MNFADQRVLKSTPATLAARFVDQDGAARAPTAPVTVAITKADGSVLQAATPASVGAGEYAGVGWYTFAVTAAQTATLEHLTCTWTATSGEILVTHVDVVGAYAFTLSDMASLDGMSGLSTARQRELRQAVEELVELRTGWLWTPRLIVESRVLAFNSGSKPIRLNYLPFRLMRSVEIDGVAQTVGDWSFSEWGATQQGWAWSAGAGSTLEMIYEAGEDRPPVSLVQAFLDAACQNQLDRAKGSSSRVLSQTNEFGNINYARATAENLFGNPAVDAVLALWDRRIPATA